MIPSTGSPFHVFWFRRDLRLQDNTGLLDALQSGLPVLPVFIFDRNILDELDDRDDARVNFIHAELETLHRELKDLGSGIFFAYGKPFDLWKKWLSNWPVQGVFTNRDVEPYGIQRDREVQKLFAAKGLLWKDRKDQVIFERDDVLKPDGEPYSVYTPYSRRWKECLQEHPVVVRRLPSKPNWFQWDAPDIPTLASMGFQTGSIVVPAAKLARKKLENYAASRDFPAQEGTSRLGIHLRFGTISIRKLVEYAAQHSAVYLNELIWREFYQMILYHHPRVVREAFKPAYDRIPWRDDEEAFEQWVAGRTGFALVDAGMRELAATGYMHNRVRMLTASFLSKDLLLDWRLGEAWFARKLLDFELASNNGGWQWAAGTGCDAAPYFRVFNPFHQAQKFDPEERYIRQWIPEYGTPDYPDPILDHYAARDRALEVYKKALAGG